MDKRISNELLEQSRKLRREFYEREETPARQEKFRQFQALGEKVGAWDTSEDETEQG